MSRKEKKQERGAGRKVRVFLRPKRGRPGRQKGWTRQYVEGVEEGHDVPLGERVMAKGEISRKRTVIEPHALPVGADAEQGSGVVLAIRGPVAQVDEGGRVWRCTIRRMLRTRRIEERGMVAVGDRVRFTRVSESTEDWEGVIESVGPRKGVLTRRYGRRVQTTVANVDQVVIVASVGLPPLKAHLIDRYVVAAEAGGLRAVICVNKIDLDEDGQAEPTLQMYRRLGYPGLATSAAEGVGIEGLREALAGRQSVIAGQSGVGKSALLNAVQPGLKLKVGPVSEATLKGRHTTPSAELLRLEFGGYVVDTPGIRQFELARVTPAELEACFVEFVPLVARCKFADCSHIPEDGCAIKQAVERGEVDAQRYESYVRLFDELMETQIADEER